MRSHANEQLTNFSEERIWNSLNEIERKEEETLFIYIKYTLRFFF